MKKIQIMLFALAIQLIHGSDWRYNNQAQFDKNPPTLFNDYNDLPSKPSKNDKGDTLIWQYKITSSEQDAITGDSLSWMSNKSPSTKFYEINLYSNKPPKTNYDNTILYAILTKDSPADRFWQKLPYQYFEDEDFNELSEQVLNERDPELKYLQSMEGFNLSDSGSTHNQKTLIPLPVQQQTVGSEPRLRQEPPQQPKLKDWSDTLRKVINFLRENVYFF